MAKVVLYSASQEEAHSAVKQLVGVVQEVLHIASYLDVKSLPSLGTIACIVVVIDISGYENVKVLNYMSRVFRVPPPQANSRNLGIF